MSKLEHWFFLILALIVLKVEFDKPIKYPNRTIWKYTVRERYFMRIVLFFAKPFVERDELILDNDIIPRKIDRYKYDIVGWYK